jgi:glutamyl-tRNA synthetase
MTPRVRFAPSPTGYLHVGGARTALYNWLFARANGGTMILRSDDTDEVRSRDEYAEDILESLRWLGLDWDEGIEVGGPHGSYRQSDRLERYREVADRLVAEGKAYESFVTPEELEAFHAKARGLGISPAYDGGAEPDEFGAAARRTAGMEPSIRFRVPRPGSTGFDDIVRGKVEFDHEHVDDFVILRSDRTPTYHLASTVDDVDYAITYVVRGEDLLASTPKHILLAEAMGAEPPRYAHLSLLMGPDGKKLSKRHGHTAIGAYRGDGYLPEALVNYLALLGWNPGEDDTAVSIEEMVKRFDLDSVSKNPAIFDTEKLDWLNGLYIRGLTAADFTEHILPMVEADLERPLDTDERSILETIAPLIQERTKLLPEAAEQVRFIYADIAYDDDSWKKVMTKDEVPLVLDEASRRLTALDTWQTEEIETALRSMLADLDLGARKGLQPLRVAVSGSTVSPPLFESMEAMGRERTLERLAVAGARLEE